MTNIVPQARGLNAGPWERFEEFERHLATDPTADVYVVAGGVFGAHPALIGAGVAVRAPPSRCWWSCAAGRGPRT